MHIFENDIYPYYNYNISDKGDIEQELIELGLREQDYYEDFYEGEQDEH